MFRLIRSCARFRAVDGAELTPSTDVGEIYEPPVLIDLGTLEEVTQGVFLPGSDLAIGFAGFGS